MSFVQDRVVCRFVNAYFSYRHLQKAMYDILLCFSNVLFQVFLLRRLDKNTKALNVIMMHLNEAVSQYLKFCSSSVFTHHSHTRRLLSSDVLTNRRFSSTKVMVLTAPRWRSYSWTTSPFLMSHWRRDKGKVDYSLIPSKRFVFESLVRHRLLKCCSEEKMI